MSCIDRNDAAAFVEGGLSPALTARIDAHLVECARCRELVVAFEVQRPSGRGQEHSYTIAASEGATVRARPAPARPSDAIVERGTTIGRYTILDLVGQGGFGEVFAAYDPELDRKIAMKFLRGEPEWSSAAAEARLLREAKAIAKLSHPNIVTVYDAGTFGARVFVAMEFVDGATLKDWLAERPRARAEILDVYKNAARGLAAAHAAGLVHRDFKPGNVMVRRNGGVLVMDFGLVREIAGADDASPSAADVETSALSDAPELNLTQTGELVGTPAFMAPEQLQGGRTDSRSDQFSFCVALYAALYGERPFAGDSLISLRDNVLRGRVRPPPERAGVPSWLRRVLFRGLAVDPEARFASMNALLEALADDPMARRRKWLSAAGAAMIAGALMLVTHRAGTRARMLCADGASHLAGIWEPRGVDSPGKRAIREAFVRTGRAYAPRAFERTSELLDGYVERWLGIDRDACEATRLRSEQSEEVLALRTACLRDRLSSLRAITDVFTHADQGVVLNAVGAVDALPSLESCSDVRSLSADTSLADPALQQRIRPLRERFARVEALSLSGQCAAADAQGKPLLADLRAVGYRPLLAEALILVAKLGNDCVDPHTSIARAKEAYAVAVAARLDRTATEAALLIPVVAINRLGDGPLAGEWLDIARASFERSGDDSQRGNLLTAEAMYAGSKNDLEGWVALSRKAYEVTRQALGADHDLTLVGLGNIGDALAGAGHLEEAVAADRRAVEAARRTFGPVHPFAASFVYNTCEALNGLGRFAEARRECLDALAMWTAAGTDVGLMSYGQTGLGIALLGLGRAAEAIEPLELAVRARVDEKVAPRLIGESRFALARALWSRPADQARARTLARLARADAAGDVKMRARIDAWLAKAGANAPR